MEKYYAVTYSNSLSHHGVKGMKWGIRKLKERHARWKARRHANYELSKADNKEAREDRNPFLGRKINASRADRIKRGEKLRKQGRTKMGAIGRYVGRNIQMNVVRGIASYGVNTLASASGSPYAAIGANVANSVINSVGLYQDVSSLIRTYQDISDMSAYDNRKRKH